MTTTEQRSGLLLLLVSALALLMANSAWAGVYYQCQKTLGPWVNDGLMGLFFVLMGLEIKRETRENAAILAKSAYAALGGMVLPALLYGLVHGGSRWAAGWAIPTVTDIAFSVAVLSCFSKKIPASMRLFLLSMAVLDDVGGVLLMAFGSMFGGVGHPPHIHISLVGVGLALVLSWCVPSPWLNKLENALIPWVRWLILPVFAWLCMGLSFSGLTNFKLQVFPWGIVLGLCVGKPVGMVLGILLWRVVHRASWPEDWSLGLLWCVGSLAGIGFTVSFLMVPLAFHTLAQQQLAVWMVVLGSSLSALMGAVGLLWYTRR